MNEVVDDPDSVPIRPAATVVVVRDGTEARTSLEVLLVCRNRELAFHGGSWVFPGGRVDDGELDAADGDEDAAARAAAVREVHEESGLTISSDELLPYSHWTTPKGRNRRFATSFYLAALTGGADDVAIDDGEIHDFGWFTPAEAVRMSEEAKIQLAGPTYVSLLRLRAAATVVDAVELVRREPYLVFRPRLHVLADGTQVSLYEGDAAYDADDPDVEGPRHRMVMRDTTYEYLRS